MREWPGRTLKETVSARIGRRIEETVRGWSGRALKEVVSGRSGKAQCHGRQQGNWNLESQGRLRDSVRDSVQEVRSRESTDVHSGGSGCAGSPASSAASGGGETRGSSSRETPGSSRSPELPWGSPGSSGGSPGGSPSSS